MTDANKKTDAWMPLWIGAYLADTMRLTTAQHGGYLLLLMAYWRERAPLPDDDEELRSITKTDKSEWKKMRPVLAKFFVIGEGIWWHKRVEAEMVTADARQSSAQKKAQAGAKARWEKVPKDATSNAPSMPQALPEDLLKQCPTPTPSPLGIGNPDFVAEELHPLNPHTGRVGPGEICKALKAIGIGDVNPGHADLLMLLEAGAEQSEFEGAARTSVKNAKGFAYTLGIVKRSREAAAKTLQNIHQGAMPAQASAPNRQVALEQRNRKVADEWAAQGDAHESY